MAVPSVHSAARQAGAPVFHASACLDAAAPDSEAVTRAGPWLGQLALSLSVDVRRLAEFSALMARQGFKPELSRFFLDLVYGYRQLAIAHSLGEPRLRALSLELFDACQRLDLRRRRLLKD
jgi:hypothetical protein